MPEDRYPDDTRPAEARAEASASMLDVDQRLRELLREHESRMLKTERRRTLDLDVRGMLAILAVLCSFGLAFAQLFLQGNADIPAWAAAVVTGIAGFYFGSRGSNGKH